MKLVESRQTGGEGAFPVEDAVGEEVSAPAGSDWRAEEVITAGSGAEVGT